MSRVLNAVRSRRVVAQHRDVVQRDSLATETVPAVLTFTIYLHHRRTCVDRATPFMERLLSSTVHLGIDLAFTYMGLTNGDTAHIPDVKRYYTDMYTNHTDNKKNELTTSV